MDYVENSIWAFTILGKKGLICVEGRLKTTRYSVSQIAILPSFGTHSLNEILPFFTENFQVELFVPLYSFLYTLRRFMNTLSNTYIPQVLTPSRCP